MTIPQRQDLAAALVELSDTLVADFDVLDFLHVLAGRCVDLLGVSAAGIMIADQRGALRVMASSSEQARLLELFEVETDEGPCVDCYAGGVPVADPDLDTPDPRWQRFAGRARQAGFRAVHAVPVRLRDEVIGVLNLFAAGPGPLPGAAAQSARALANVTAIGLLQHRAVEYRQLLAEQLQYAMNSRVVIEQAKGIIAEHLDLDMAAAFEELRRFAARVGQRLTDVATAITTGDYEPPVTDRSGRMHMLLVRRFDRSTLGELREAVGAAAARHGLSGPQANRLVLAVHEAASNAIRHGGGAGQLLLWLQGGDLGAEIGDRGHGIPADRMTIPARVGDTLHGGRGLWLINKVCVAVEIETGSTGTHLLLRYPRDSRATPEFGAAAG